MCKQWPPPVNVYADTAKHLPGEEKLFIFLVYLGMACLDVVSGCLCTKGFPGFSLGEGMQRECRAFSALLTASGVPRVAEMEFFGLECTLKVNTATGS